MTVILGGCGQGSEGRRWGFEKGTGVWWVGFASPGVRVCREVCGVKGGW